MEVRFRAIPSDLIVRSHGSRSAPKRIPVNFRTTSQYLRFPMVRVTPRKSACSVRCSRVAFIGRCYFGRLLEKKSARAESGFGPRNHFWPRSLDRVQMHSAGE
jgi:hypothetical protein